MNLSPGTDWFLGPM